VFFGFSAYYENWFKELADFWKQGGIKAVLAIV
jgi:hypothetical protein